MEDRLQKFAKLVEEGSFTKAAAKLHVSQPGLTLAIKKLERELKTELLIRGCTPLKTTPAGALAYTAAKKIKTESLNLKLQLEEIKQGKTDLNLGMIDSIAETLFVQANELDKLEAKNNLSLSINNSSLLASQIENDTLDLAFTAQPSNLPAKITSIFLGVEPLVLVVASDYLKHYKALIKSHELPNFLAYNQQSNTYKLIDEHMAKSGIKVRPRFYSSSPTVLLEMVLRGKGAAVLPYDSVKQHMASSAICLLKIGKSHVVERRIFALIRTGRVLPTSANELIQTTQKILQELRSEASAVDR